MAVDFLAELKKLIGLAETPDSADGIGETGDDELGLEETPADEPAAEEAPADVPTAGDEPVAEAGAGASNTIEAASDAGAETMPASEVSLAELRDRLNKMAAENESLRNRVAELGGDADSALLDDGQGGEEFEPADAAATGYDPDDEEAAQADVDAQLADIARLSGK